MIARRLCVALVLVGFGVLAGTATPTGRVALREPLETLPLRIGSWQLRSATPFDAATLSMLGVDDYVNRVYASPEGRPIGLYVGFYESQRNGDSIHSPLNCLPGAGWEPVTHERLRLPVEAPTTAARTPGGEVVVNGLVVRKGDARQAVVYWYQSRGRVVASEYRGKLLTVADALRLRRTDAAMVRIITPIDGPDASSEWRARKEAAAFAATLLPVLRRHLPG